MLLLCIVFNMVGLLQSIFLFDIINIIHIVCHFKAISDYIMTIQQQNNASSHKHVQGTNNLDS